MNRLVNIAAVFVASFILSTMAIGQEVYEEGKHYKRLDTAVRTSNPNKIELVEAFSYTCAHCYSFEPLVKSYKKTLADDVNFVRTHVTWNAMNENLARALYTAKALKVEDEIHEALFKGFHLERKVIRTEKEIQSIFSSLGVDDEKFKKAYNSFGINSQTKQATAKIRGYKLDSTPQLIVNGEYVISANRDINHQQMLEIASYLIEKIRNEKN
ncbi:MAG: thiol:disulfide interchange protein DsbA/DsbL [Cellvibrionaceae bacterium]